MKKLRRFFLICCIPVFLVVNATGCALLTLPLGLLSALVTLPLGLVSGLFSLIGPATNAAATAAPYALMFVKNDTAGNAVSPHARNPHKKIEDLRKQAIPVDEVVLARLKEDPQIDSVIFVALDDTYRWHRFQESMDMLSARGYHTTCVIMQKGSGQIRQERIDAVSEMMEKQGIKFYTTT